MSPEPPKPPDDWAKIWFQNAHSDMRWAKEQSWRALQWAVVLFAALAAAASKLPDLPTTLFVILALCVAIIAIYYLLDLHWFGRRSRETSERLVREIPGRAEFLPKRHTDPHHYALFVVRIAVVIAALVMTLLLLTERGNLLRS